MLDPAARHKLFRSRVRLIVHTQQVLHRELRISLRGRKALVSEHFLNSAQVGSFFQHVGAEGMAQRVRMNLRRETFRDRDPFNNAPDTAGG